MAKKVTKAAAPQVMSAHEQAVERAKSLLGLRQTLEDVAKDIEELEVELRKYVAESGVREFGGLKAYDHKSAATLKGATGTDLDEYKAELMTEFPKLGEMKLKMSALTELAKTDKHLQNSLAAKGLHLNQSRKTCFKAV